MKKVILNKCYGGFGLSPKAYQLYAKKKGFQAFAYKGNYDRERKVFYYTKLNYLSENPSVSYFIKDFGDNVWINEEEYEKYNLYLSCGYREDKTLIEVVEELGDEANSIYSKLVIVEIPDDLDYMIDEYDGIETLHQKVQEW